MSCTFACYFPAEKPLFITAKIDWYNWVRDLSKAIAAELKLEGQDIRPSELCLFKTDISLKPKESLHSRVLQWLHEQPEDTQVDEMSDLESTFPNGPHARKNLKLDIIVANAEDDVVNRKVRKGPHVVVERPIDTQPPIAPAPAQRLSINCLVFGEGREQMFTICLPSTENVSTLKSKIKGENPVSFNLDARNLLLWKVDMPLDNYDPTKLQLQGQGLMPEWKLAEVFSASSDPKHVQIIVKPLLLVSVPSPFPPSSSQAVEGDVAGLCKKFWEGRGDETGVDPKDIDLIMQQVNCTRAKAVQVLKESGGDLINAIIAASE